MIELSDVNVDVNMNVNVNVNVSVSVNVNVYRQRPAVRLVFLFFCLFRSREVFCVVDARSRLLALALT